MDQLFVLGTGNAVATKCYNTCFALYNEEEYFLIDTGGGNGILKILEDMNMDIRKIHHIFITHEHTDHLLGIIWMIRIIAANMKKGSYANNLYIYCHSDLVKTIDTICKLTLQEKIYKMIGDRIFYVPVTDQEEKEILNYKVTFFDIHSTKATQFGFTVLLENKKRLTCLGDEPYHPLCAEYAKGSDWLLHEAFCLYQDRKLYQPYEKHHSTVKEACELSESLGIPNLILWHTEDKNIRIRKRLYTEEGKKYYHGNLMVPNDKEIIDIG